MPAKFASAMPGKKAVLEVTQQSPDISRHFFIRANITK